MDMHNNDVLTFHPLEHPDPRVQRVGFDLTDPYVELCWGPVVGPTATLLLRRLPVLWVEAVPATIGREELSRSLGLGAGTGQNSRLMVSIDRLVPFNFAEWDTAQHTLGVYRQAPGLGARNLARLPEWSTQTHERLLDAHIRTICARDQTADKVSTITARLDRLQQPAAIPAPAPIRTIRQ